MFTGLICEGEESTNILQDGSAANGEHNRAVAFQGEGSASCLLH